MERSPTISPSLFSRRATLITQAGASWQQRQQSQPRQPPPAVQSWVFHSERQQAFDPHQPSGLLLLDRSKQLQLKSPGTTPSLLAAYIKVKAQESITTCFQGGLEFYFVICGEGRSEWGGGVIAWQPGDLFFLPGGSRIHHQAADSDALVYALTDEPLARFLGLQAGQNKFEPIHYLAKDVQAAQAAAIEHTRKSGVMHFGRKQGQAEEFVYSSFLPTWKWIVPGEHQRPHCHAAVAVQLFIAGQQSYSIIDGDRVLWQDFTVAVSPAGSLHSHHNEGDDLGIYLVAQDFSLHRYLRTYWYEEPESQTYRHDW